MFYVIHISIITQHKSKIIYSFLLETYIVVTF